MVYNAVGADSLREDTLFWNSESRKGVQVRAESGRRVVCGMLGAVLLLGAGMAPARAQIDMDRSKFYADPSKYALYGCQNIAQVRPNIVGRLAQLEALIAKAEASPGGGFVAALAYSDEYKANQGDLRNIDARAAELNCPPPPPSKATPSPAAPPAPRERHRGRH